MEPNEAYLTVVRDGLVNSPQDSALQDFARAAAYSLLQSPIKALSQPIDAITGTTLAKNTLFISAPEQADYNTKTFWAQQAGHALGTLGSFYVAGKIVKDFTRGGLTEAQLATTLSNRGVLGLTLKETALTGLIHDSILRPTADEDKNALLTARATAGVNGALTLSSMTLAGFGLKRAGSRNEVINGTLSGIPGGLINAELHSIFQQGKLATVEQLTQSVVTMSVIGAGFGGWHQYKGKYESGRQNFNWIDGTASDGSHKAYKISGGERAITKMLDSVFNGDAAVVSVRQHHAAAPGWRGMLGLHHYGPEQSMLIQHGPRIDASLAATVDLVASCNFAATRSLQSVLPSDTVYMRAGKDRISLSAAPPAIRVGEATPLKLGVQGSDALSVAEPAVASKPVHSAADIVMPHERAKIDGTYNSGRLSYRFSYADPTVDALNVAAAQGKLIEIGAGNGYWAHLLRDLMGVDVIAFDDAPVKQGKNSYFPVHHENWTEVREGGAEAITQHPDRTLLLCFPPPSDSMARNALSYYRGNRLIYVGIDSSRELTGCKIFNRELCNAWIEVERCEIPTGRRESVSLRIFERNLDPTPRSPLLSGYAQRRLANESIARLVLSRETEAAEHVLGLLSKDASNISAVERRADLSIRSMVDNADVGALPAAELALRYGKRLHEAGQPQLSAKYFTKAAELAGTNAPLVVSAKLGVALTSGDAGKEARVFGALAEGEKATQVSRDQYRSMLAQSGNDGNLAHPIRAEIYERLLASRAESELKNVEQHLEYRTAMTNYAKVLFELGQPLKARELLEKIHAVDVANLQAAEAAITQYNAVVPEIWSAWTDRTPLDIVRETRLLRERVLESEALKERLGR